MPENIFPGKKSNERIEKISIPDDDMVGWIETLRSGNYSEKEIDGILSKLNRTYRDKAHPDWIEKVLADVESLLESDYGKVLTEEQKESFRKFAREYL